MLALRASATSACRRELKTSLVASLEEYTPDKPSPILRALKRYEPGKTSLHRVKLSPNTSPLTIGRNLGEKWPRPPADGLYMPRDRSGGQNSVPTSRLSLADGRSRPRPSRPRSCRKLVADDI